MSCSVCHHIVSYHASGGRELVDSGVSEECLFPPHLSSPGRLCAERGPARGDGFAGCTHEVRGSATHTRCAACAGDCDACVRPECDGDPGATECGSAEESGRELAGDAAELAWATTGGIGGGACKGGAYAAVSAAVFPCPLLLFLLLFFFLFSRRGRREGGHRDAACT